MNPIGYHVTSRVFIRTFQCSGIWFPDKVSYLYSIYAVVLYIFCSLFYASFTIVNLCSVKSVADATPALFMVTIIFSIASKTTNFLFFNKRIRKLFHRLNTDFDLCNETERNFVNVKLRSFLNIFIAFYVLCVFCVTTGVFSSALKPKVQLPFPTWHPLNWKNDNLSFWFAWSHLSFSTYLAISTNAGVQLFASYLMLSMTLLIQILGQRLCKLWCIVDERKKVDKKSGNELIDCIEMHQKILEYGFVTFVLKNTNFVHFRVLHEYKICFSYILLYDICSTALGMCSTVYQLVMVRKKRVKNVHTFTTYFFSI